MNPKLSRRGLLKGALAVGGAAIGSRIAGPFVRTALAAPEPSHFVHIFFNGGLNALFAGNADKFAGRAFGVTDTNIKDVGDGVFTDLDTFGTFPQFALDHWAAVGMRHGNALHTTPQNQRSGGERAILRDGGDCYLNKLAHAMGGDSAFKAVYFGDRAPAYQEQPTYQGVPLQRVSESRRRHQGPRRRGRGSERPLPCARRRVARDESRGSLRARSKPTSTVSAP